MAGDYIKCPRCELNYIHKDQELCDVCKAELAGKKLLFAVDEEDIAGENQAKEKLCPICKVNTISVDEEMCAQCKKASLYVEDQEIDIDKDEEWKNYLDDAEEEEEKFDDEDISLSKLVEEESKEFFDDEEEEIEYIGDNEPDDFDLPPLDDDEIDDEDDEDDDDFDDDDEIDDEE